MNSNAMSGLYEVSKYFLFGHEIGHKIQIFKDAEEFYELGRRIYDTNDQCFLKEVFFDICGTIVSNIMEILRYPMNEEIHSYLKQKTLKCIYRN